MEQATKVDLWVRQDGVCSKTHLSWRGIILHEKAGDLSEALHITRSGVRILFSVLVVHVHDPLFLVYTKTLPLLPVALWRPSIWPFSISSHVRF
jgi:hypothetical protein